MKIFGKKIKAPKVTFSTKKAIKSVTGAFTAIPKAAVSGITEVASAAASGAGQVLSTPGAAPLLGAAGMAFGIPGVGALAENFASRTEATLPEAPQSFISSPPSSGGNKNIFLIAGGGAFLLLTVLFLILSRKKG